MEITDSVDGMRVGHEILTAEIAQQAIGRDVECVSQAGDDPHGRFVEATLELAQVRVRQIGEPSEFALGEFGEAALTLDEVAERLHARRHVSVLGRS